MRSLFPSTHDRADVLMSAGCSTFVSAALILVIPRVGIVLLEILLGLFFIGCALAARARLRIQARSQVKEGPEGSTNAKAKWLDVYKRQAPDGAHFAEDGPGAASKSMLRNPCGRSGNDQQHVGQRDWWRPAGDQHGPVGYQ